MGNLFVDRKPPLMKILESKKFLSGNLGWVLPPIRDLVSMVKPYILCENCFKVFDAKTYGLSYCVNCRSTVTLFRGPIYTSLSIDMDKFFPENLVFSTLPMSNSNLKVAPYVNGGLSIEIILQNSWYGAVRGLSREGYLGFVSPFINQINRHNITNISGRLLTPLQAVFVVRVADEINRIMAERIPEEPDNIKPITFLDIVTTDESIKEQKDVAQFVELYGITERNFTTNKSAYLLDSFLVSK